MRIAFGFLLMAILSGSYATTFPNTESVISEGGNWTQPPPTWNAPVSTVGGTPGHAVGLNSSATNDSIAMLTGNGFGNNSVIECVIFGTNAAIVSEVEQHHRVTYLPGSPDKVFLYEVDWTPGLLGFVRWDGTQGTITAFSNVVTANLVDGDVVRSAVTSIGAGVLIQAWLNNTLVLTDIDATPGKLSTGNPGMGFDAGNPVSGATFGFKSFSVYTFGGNTRYSAAHRPKPYAPGSPR